MLAAFTDVQTLRGGPQAQSFLLQMSQLRNSSRPLMSDIRPIAQALGMSVLDIRTATAERAGITRRTGETDVAFETRIGAAERSGRITGETMSEGILSLLTQRTGMGLGGFAQARGQGLGAAMSNLAEAPTNLIATIAGIENSPGVAALARTMTTIGDVMAGVGPQGARLQAMISGLVDSVGSGLGGLHAGVVAESLGACKFTIRAQIVWVKTRPALSRGHYHWQHEPAFYGVRDGADDDQWRFVPEHEVSAYAVKKGATGSWHGDRKQSTVWFIEHLKSGTGHGTQKPVECMRRPIENNSSPGQAIYEPFSGSGTTLIACEMTGRHCYAVELNPVYVDVAVRRWQEFTGKEATLEGDGRTFAAIAAERQE